MSRDFGLPRDVCLQCGQSRQQVREQGTICGIVSGYEYQELVCEWPRHHWRDWSDADLATANILPERWDEYRRASPTDLQYAACEDTIRGHNLADRVMPDWGVAPGQCIECGHKPPIEKIE